MDDEASHDLLRTAIGSLTRLSHRGAVAADGKSGDGCGLLLKTPDSFLRALADEAGFALAPGYAVGMVFLSQDPALADSARGALERELAREGLEPLGWRPVPVDPSVCGEQALDSLPRIEQIFVNAPGGMDTGVLRASPLHRPQAHGEGPRERRRRLLRPQPLVQGRRLQGARHAGQAGGVLRGSPRARHERVALRLSSAFLHEYLARVAARATVPIPGPQRRDQHHPAGNRNWAVARSYKFQTPLLTGPGEDLRPLVSTRKRIGLVHSSTTCWKCFWPAAWTSSAQCAS